MENGFARGIHPFLGSMRSCHENSLLWGYKKVNTAWRMHKAFVCKERTRYGRGRLGPQRVQTQRILLGISSFLASSPPPSTHIHIHVEHQQAFKSVFITISKTKQTKQKHWIFLSFIHNLPLVPNRGHRPTSRISIDSDPLWEMWIWWSFWIAEFKNWSTFYCWSIHWTLNAYSVAWDFLKVCFNKDMRQVVMSFHR